jgi:hypothetical protein
MVRRRIMPVSERVSRATVQGEESLAEREESLRHMFDVITVDWRRVVHGLATLRLVLLCD